ncbi:hypothetical protein [Chryseobacterium sp.]|uniref:hypothetical protein n=1 Tax=Chryseobacterium sp. TaxID=1871047 RepID=UPI0025BE1342|nr:hypothetical protein [Chryseobacterium sp.]
MRKMFLLVSASLSLNMFGQFGVGTKDVHNGIILQVESQPETSSTYYGGVLFPRVALTSTELFAPVTGQAVTGLMVYNTATSGSGDSAVTPGIYYWDGSGTTSEWVRMAQKEASETALFSNQNTSTDINADDGIFAPIFENVRFNNNPSLYQKIDNTTLKINEVGYYKVILNLDLASSGGADNFGIEIVVNNQDNIVSDNLYIPGRWDTEGGAESNFPNGKTFVVYIPINVAGYTLRVRSYEIDPSTDVQFKNPDTSTISIEKIR